MKKALFVVAGYSVKEGVDVWSLRIFKKKKAARKYADSLEKDFDFTLFTTGEAQ